MKKKIIKKIDAFINNKNFYKYNNFLLSYNFGVLKEDKFFFVKDIKTISKTYLPLNMKYSLLLTSYKTEKDFLTFLKNVNNKSVVVYFKIRYMHFRLRKNIELYFNSKKKSLTFCLKFNNFWFLKTFIL